MARRAVLTARVGVILAQIPALSDGEARSGGIDRCAGVLDRTDRGLRHRLSFGLHSVRHRPDAACGRPRFAQHRLRQYRRDQCAAHGKEGLGGRDPSRRHAEGNGGGCSSAPSSAPPAALVAACGAFLGHLFPVWLGFKGGKGVATFLGCLIGLFWPAALAFAVVWLAVAFITRYSSLAALIGEPRRCRGAPRLSSLRRRRWSSRFSRRFCG